jgi:drug/metabolite transporter (DMT)-like permease
MNSPAVNTKLLPVLAGMVWSAVGLVLAAVAVYWLAITRASWILPLAAGLVVGLLVYRLGFLRLVRRNKARLYARAEGREKVCIFAFQSWRSYVIVVVMMALGYYLRHLPISRVYLVPVYLAIGAGLFLASLHYYSGAQ